MNSKQGIFNRMSVGMHEHFSLSMITVPFTIAMTKTNDSENAHVLYHIYKESSTFYNQLGILFIIYSIP